MANNSGSSPVSEESDDDLEDADEVNDPSDVEGEVAVGDSPGEPS